jgi:hypothetical protein
MSAFWRCTLTFRNTLIGTLAQNVLYMEDASETLQPDAIRIKLEQFWWGSAANIQLRAMSSFNSQLFGLSLQKISPAPPGGTIPMTAPLTVGNHGVAPLHPTLGFCFTLLDGGAGRKHRGRVYHCGTPGNLISNGVPAANAITLWTTLRDAWLNAFGPLPTSDLFWNIFHRSEQGDARFTRVVDLRLSPVIRVQRRRNIGVGF